MIAGVLHCNLNARDVAAAAPVYEALGMRVVMRSRSDGYDATPMGLPRMTQGDAWFLYDGRGGRRAPALELLQWLDPPTTGAAYAGSTEVGLQATRFAVPDVDAAVAALMAAGASPAPDGPGDAATVLDADGARVELAADRVDAPELRGARLVVRDLHRATAFYEALGFAAGDETDVEWAGGDGGRRVRERVLASPGPPRLDVHLTAWPGGPAGRAHGEPHHRGLYRLACAVPDVEAAVATVRSVGADAGDPVFVPMPGTPLGGLRVAFLRDPDGVTVELVERDLQPS